MVIIQFGKIIASTPNPSPPPAVGPRASSSSTSNPRAKVAAALRLADRASGIMCQATKKKCKICLISVRRATKPFLPRFAVLQNENTSRCFFQHP
jgi:hypothetical protein